MTRKVTHIKRRGVQSWPGQDGLSEYGHNGSGTQANRSIKPAIAGPEHLEALVSPAGIPITRPKNFHPVKRRGQRKDN